MAPSHEQASQETTPEIQLCAMGSCPLSSIARSSWAKEPLYCCHCSSKPAESRKPHEEAQTSRFNAQEKLRHPWSDAAIHAPGDWRFVSGIRFQLSALDFKLGAAPPLSTLNSPLSTLAAPQPRARPRRHGRLCAV